VILPERVRGGGTKSENTREEWCGGASCSKSRGTGLVPRRIHRRGPGNISGEQILLPPEGGGESWQIRSKIAVRGGRVSSTGKKIRRRVGVV